MSNFRFVRTVTVVIRPEDYTWSVGLRNLIRFQWGFQSRVPTVALAFMQGRNRAVCSLTSLVLYHCAQCWYRYLH
jgi:hypothetical protein